MDNSDYSLSFFVFYKTVVSDGFYLVNLTEKRKLRCFLLLHLHPRIFDITIQGWTNFSSITLCESKWTNMYFFPHNNTQISPSTTICNFRLSRMMQNTFSMLIMTTRYFYSRWFISHGVYLLGHVTALAWSHDIFIRLNRSPRGHRPVIRRSKIKIKWNSRTDRAL